MAYHKISIFADLPQKMDTPRKVKLTFCRGTNAPNTKWVVRFIYIPPHEGWLYWAAVMDFYLRAIVGGSMADQVSAGLVKDTQQHAIVERQPGPRLLPHSARDSQYASN